MTLLVGITGSFASGKTFILNYLAHLGFATFSADEYVKEIYKEKIIQQKVQELLDIDHFDKNLIANQIYQNDADRVALQSFIHPYVLKGIENFKLNNINKKLIFAEVPLLFESDLKKYFNLVVTTFCSEESRLQRAKTRHNFSQSIYKKIETIQWSQSEKIKNSDLAVDTDVNLVMLELRIAKLVEECLYYA